MRVISDFVRNELSEDQLLPVVQDLLPAVLNILGNPEVCKLYFSIDQTLTHNRPTLPLLVPPLCMSSDKSSACWKLSERSNLKLSSQRLSHWVRFGLTLSLSFCPKMLVPRCNRIGNLSIFESKSSE